IVGTVAYMSPEQAEGQTVDRRTDIWALGIVLYEMLTARRPFDGDSTPRTMVDILQKRTPRLSGVPRGVWQVVERCLQKDRSARQEAVPRAHALADHGEYAAAYRLALEAERYIPRDPALRDLWPDVTRTLSVETSPTAAEVMWKPYRDTAEPWHSLGRAPIV